MATTTSTYGFIKPDTDEYVSPSAYNQNFDKIENALKTLGVDYIVAQGTQGIWQFRRWNSGVAECWIEEYTIPTLYIQSEWSTGQYYGTVASIGTYPVEFIKPPMVIPTWSQYATSGTGYSCPMWAVPDGTLKKMPTLQFLDRTYGTASNAKIAIYVKGRWK